MSLFRAPISKTLTLAASPACRRVSPICLRHKSNTANDSTEPPRKSDSTQPPAPPAGDSSMIRKEGPSAATVRHNQPDYEATVDQATSAFSPVPKRVMDGSEDTGVTPAAVLSGAPVDLQARTVRIYRPAKTATQSGDWHSHQWRMDWDVLGKGHRWENFLMGWQSSGDFMQGTHLNFNSKDDAIRFAEKQGYEYFVQEFNERKLVPKAYANNFVHHPKKLKVIRTK